MLFTTLIESICNRHNLWLTSGAIAILAALASNPSTALAENLNRLNPAPNTNGVYLYGESNQPEIIGKEYIIFETTGTKTIGAFYLPKSEFSCFKGQFHGARLSVNLIDTFDRQNYNFTLTLNPSGLTASKLPMMGEPTYQPLGAISANDRQILASCKAQLQS
jgi:hypothetical protein